MTAEGPQGKKLQLDLYIANGPIAVWIVPWLNVWNIVVAMVYEA